MGKGLLSNGGLGPEGSWQGRWLAQVQSKVVACGGGEGHFTDPEQLSVRAQRMSVRKRSNQLLADELGCSGIESGLSSSYYFSKNELLNTISAVLDASHQRVNEKQIK